MDLYVSTACLCQNYTSLSVQLSDYLASGFSRIELGFCPPLDGLSLPSDLWNFSAKFHLHNYFPPESSNLVINLASQDEAVLTKSIAYCRRAIQLSSILGASFYSVHSGFLADFKAKSLGRELLYDDLYSYEDGYKTFLHSLEILAQEADEAGVALLIEPSVCATMHLIDGKNKLMLMCHPEEFLRLFQDLSTDNIFVLLDSGHLKVTAKTLGFTEKSFLESISGKVRAVHLHDNQGDSDEHLPLIPESPLWSLLDQFNCLELPVIIEAKFSSTVEIATYINLLRKARP